MPGGHGFRGGRGGGRRRMFFLQSSLMVLLLRQPGYGYSLIEGLTQFGFQPEQVDASIIYRALRDLESMALVSDSWDSNSLGPPRRIYTVTPQGKAALEEWMAALHRNRREIEALEAAYEAARKQT